MRIWDGDKWKTAFYTRYGHFKYQVINFGLSNTPVSFQRYINKILAESLNIFVMAYLDDVLIYINNKGQLYIDVVRWVLEQDWRHELYATLKKCRFHKDEVQFLDFFVLGQGIRMEEVRIEAVRD